MVLANIPTLQTSSFFSVWGKILPRNEKGLGSVGQLKAAYVLCRCRFVSQLLEFLFLMGAGSLEQSHQH